MKIISWNVNGLRAVLKRNFLDWFNKEDADIYCFQEIKIQQNQLPQDIKKIDHHSLYNFAQKKGYSSVAIYSKIKPLKAEYNIDLKVFDTEGRMIRLDFPKFSLINLYLPHGGRNKEKLEYKLKSYKKLFTYINKIKRNLILIGDFNIAHREIDLARPKHNQKNIMFTPEERKQIDKLIESGFIDTFRQVNQKEGNYTWWPYFANCRKRNLGWRIDYAFISKNLKNKLKKATIQKDVFGSDHCPIKLEIF